MYEWDVAGMEGLVQNDERSGWLEGCAGGAAEEGGGSQRAGGLVEER
jgi:hypothetical protein